MNKTVKIILIVIIAIAIIFGLIKWVILPMTIQKQAQDTIENVDLNSDEINAFNVKFTAYEGTQKGSTIKALVQMVSMNNSTSDKLVAINFNGTTYSSTNVSSVSSLITTSNTYNVTLKYDSKGYVETISIK
jgi:predicted PurR-regulated permease PerM